MLRILSYLAEQRVDCGVILSVCMVYIYSVKFCSGRMTNWDTLRTCMYNVYVPVCITVLLCFALLHVPKGPGSA